MDTNAHVANLAIGSMQGLTAFSALPDAPVLPYKERQRRLTLTRSARLRVRGAPRPAAGGQIVVRRSRSAFAITETELKAIAAAAMTGVSKIPNNG